MFLSRSMPEDAIHIVNCFGCENIIECFVDPSIWLTYSFNGMRYQDGWVRAENLMIRYFDGENSQNEKLPFGCPMVTRIHPSEGPACESQLTFAAALPNKWAQVPQPRTDELTLSQWPKLHVYARLVPIFPLTDAVDSYWFYAHFAKLASGQHLPDPFYPF
ncbi:hypothetical protein CRM22_008173 [Opisthorchis felineus]|uniref:Uncharacterized protein n=1 Tax=Opisthorchis felineus TaxID=147828 RepID=A0A4S2LJI4_OPIFE|nr:hypothetical protein CRM22_008173 [Opisthorchis felineus]